MIYLMKKSIDPDAMPILYDRPFTQDSIAEDFDVRDGCWCVEDGWLTGRHPYNSPGMIISRRDFFGDVMLDVKARTVLPCSHDINVMWNGSWDLSANTRSVAYVAGLQGWWRGKVGFERSPEYKLNAGTPLFPFEPGRTYHIQAGSIGGHVFIIVDGALLLEVTDPDPIDTSRYGRIGFEAYCAQVQFRDLKVRRAVYTPVDEAYVPEF